LTPAEQVSEDPWVFTFNVSPTTRIETSPSLVMSGWDGSLVDADDRHDPAFVGLQRRTSNGGA
jgi:hypothetical protein